MPRAPKHTVPRVTQDVVRRYYGRLPKNGANDYYVLESGQHTIRWCVLRVQRTQIQIGLRKGQSWHPVAVVGREVSLEDVEAFRDACRRKSRELEDEDAEPSLREGRRMTWAQCWAAFRDDYTRKRLPSGSPRTLEFYDYLFSAHILPLYGDVTLGDFAARRPAEIEDIPEVIAGRVNAGRPHYSGRHTGNHCVRAMRMVWERCRRRGWVAKDPFLDMVELPTRSADVYLEDADLAAIGRALRNLEALARSGSADTRQVPSIGALLATRVVLYTGCRHVEELLRGNRSWLREDHGIPRLEVPRAKGQRGGEQGRIVYLGPDALRCLKEIPRPEGCEDLVPGRRPGTQMSRLTDAWERIVLEARRILEEEACHSSSSILRARIVGYKGEKRVNLFEGSARIPVKATRHTVKTIHPRAGIVPDHSRQLLGHEAASLGDRVYLHQHGPSLAAAAGVAEDYLRRLIGDLDSGVLPFKKGMRR
jgi:hypothetical protein